jgi:hypothetical protein
MKVKCPKCRMSDAVVPIMYGYPSHEAWEKRDRGELALGGCTVEEKAPDYRCTECQYEWQKGKRKYGSYIEPDEE